MLVIQEFFAADAWTHLVYALLHTLWQGALLALLLRSVLRRLPATRPDTRYLASLAALVGILLCGLVTWSALEYTPPPPEVESVMTGVDAVDGEGDATRHEPVEASLTRSSGISTGPRDGLSDWTPWAATLWLGGVAVMLCRAGWLVAGAGRARRRCRVLDVASVQGCVENLRAFYRISRRVRVMVGEHINVPAVAGILWPTILLPASVVTGLPPEHLRAILAHELAHVRRWDYLVNLCQMVIESVLYFNPAVWWVGRQVRVEREACCDAMAIAATGNRIEYTRTLAASARHFGLASGELRAAQAFGDTRKPSGVLERAKRLLTPGHRPVMRLNWYSLLGVFLASGLALLALYHCSGLAVGFAAEWLSPEEKIERIAELAEIHAPIARQEYGEEDKITLSGVVRTEDGSPLPEDELYIRAGIRAPHSSIGTGFWVKSGQFTQRLEYGTVWLGTRSPDYAPAFVGPLKMEPGGVIDGIELVLRKGFSASLRLVDDEGQPVSGAEIRGGFRYEKQLTAGRVNVVSDEDGLVQIEHAIAEWPLSLWCERDGFQDTKRDDVYLEPNGVYEWVLARATPVTGVVTSAETGNPIEGALVRFVHERIGPNHGGGSHSVEDAPVVATTDGSGEFRLTRLRDGSTYHYYVQAEGHGPEWLLGVRTTDPEVKVQLGPTRYIRGTVTGALDHLARHRKRRGETEEYPIIHYEQDWKIGNHGHGGSPQEARVDIRDGVGHFEVPGVLPGKASISAGGKNVRFDVEESVDSLVIDLQEESEPVTRTVVFHLDVPPGSPPPRGGLAVRILKLGPSRSFPMPEHFPIQHDGTVRVEVPLPGDGGLGGVNVESYGLVGYWVERPGRHGQVDIPEGDEPITIHLELHPAGAIYGEVQDADGGLAMDARISVVVDRQKSELPESDPFLVSDVSNYLGDEGSGKFNLTPLPLNCTYRVVARRGHTVAISKSLRLTKRRPVFRASLEFPKGVTVHGQVLAPSGQPMVDTPVRLYHKCPGGHPHSGLPITTDGDGRFAFEDVNPDAPGDYTLDVSFTRDYQSVRQETILDGRPVTVRIKDGLTLKGVVLDDATGWPVPGAEVRAYEPLPVVRGLNMPKPEGPTNERGEFRFSTMRDRDYAFQVDSANVIREDGTYHTEVFHAGQTESATLRVIIPEWSKLEPRKPEE